MYTILHSESQSSITLLAVCSHTRVVVKNDIEKILVSPGDVELVFLKQRHQQFLPPQWHRRHIILSAEHTRVSAFFKEVQFRHLVVI